MEELTKRLLLISEVHNESTRSLMENAVVRAQRWTHHGKFQKARHYANETSELWKTHGPRHNELQLAAAQHR